MPSHSQALHRTHDDPRARVGATRRRPTRPTTVASRAAGNSHPKWWPSSPVRSRFHAGPAPSRSSGTPWSTRTCSGLRPPSLLRPLWTNTCSAREPLGLPSTAGRSARPTSDTAAIQLADTSPVTAAATAVSATARRRGGVPQARTASSTEAPSTQAASIFAWNASPSHTPATATQRARPVVAYRDAESAARSSMKIMRLSGVLPRLNAVNAGPATASAAAATSPVGPPAVRPTAR